ncbi:MAG: PAS domain S-box protein [Gemmatimonadaceae bacterium]
MNARRSLPPYAIALGALAIVVALRWLLHPVLGDTLPLVTLYAAVGVAVWHGGYRPALFVAVAGYVICLGLFMEPVDLTRQVTGFLAYLFSCAILIGFGEALRRSEQRSEIQREALRATLASIGDGVISTDGQGRVTSLNAVAEELTGWVANDAIGSPLGSIFHVVSEETRAPVESPAKQVLADGRVVTLANHSVLIARDGSECSIDDSAAPIRNRAGETVGTVLIFRSIDDRRMAERELQHSERRFRQMADVTPAMIWTANPAGTITFRNQRWREYSGLDSPDASRDWPLLVLHPDDLDRCLAAWHHALESGEDYQMEGRNRRRDGQYRWFLTRATPIRDGSNRIVEWYGSTTDIHEQKMAEVSLLEADRRKNEFLAILAHELRNPLAPVRNALQILSTDPGPDAVPQLVSMIDRQVRQLVRFIDDLLDISRITRGEIPLRPERTTLQPLIQQAVEAIAPMTASAGHSVTVRLPTEPLVVSGDPTRLAQVVGNLLHNACKYTNPGGHIDVLAERVGSHAVIHVRDDGIGISPQHLMRVFEMFMQVDTTLERAAGGLGIGLTLVRTLVEMHGGTVEALSNGAGQGSEFVIRLPLHESPLPDAERRRARESTPASGHRVLVVDDNQDGATSLATLLSLHGYETHVAHDGVAAVAAAEAFRPHLILLDIGLPKLNGHEACRRIRAQSWGRDMLMVAVTGWGQASDRKLSLDAGFNAHLVKPVELPAITQLLSALEA